MLISDVFTHQSQYLILLTRILRVYFSVVEFDVTLHLLGAAGQVRVWQQFGLLCFHDHSVSVSSATE